MNLIECIRMALSSIKANKMRSFLTMLGIIIGISSVITITTIGNSMTTILTNAFNEMGTNYFYIMHSKKLQDVKEYPELTANDMFTMEMLNGLIEQYPGQFMLNMNNYYSAGKVLDAENNYVNVDVMGVTDGYFEARNMDIIKGRTISFRDNTEGRYTAVISDVFAEQYFGSESVLGEKLVIMTDAGEEIEVNIVGVYEYKNRKKLEGLKKEEISTNLYIPYDIVQSLENNKDETYDYCAIVWNVEMGVESAEKNAQTYFEKIYKNNQYWEVYIENEQLYVEMINSVLSVLTVAIAVIAAISLLVGGVGVMNIMLVSIVERTNEIGIRKALGAQNSSIRMQFVTESIVICMIGGIVGILWGLLSSVVLEAAGLFLINAMYPDYLDVLEITIKPSMGAILISLFSSTAVGVIFGYSPANRAAKMNPIDALRYD